MRFTFLTATAGAVGLAVAGLVGSAPASGASLTWVSGVGDDANPCSRTAPCKTFAGAISKTDAGGEIHVLDPGGFGSVTITKSITIDGTEAEGGVLGSGVNGILVNAGANDRVVLRGLDLTGGYTALPGGACSPNMLTGLKVLNAKSVLLEDSRILNSKDAGILVANTTTDPTVSVVNTQIRNGCGPGIDVSPAAGRTAAVAVVNSTVSTNAIGVNAAQGGSATLIGSTVFGNGQGVTTAGTGQVITSDPGTHVVANSAIPVASTNSVASATRTWVSGVGDDANPCSRTAPCKTFAGTITKTANGGEINVLDPGNYGPVVITKGMTIDATGAQGAVAAGAGTGIIVQAGDTEDVILRGLAIQSTPGGSPACPYAATTGVSIQSGRSVHIENSTITGFSEDGVKIAPTSDNTRVVIEDTVVSNACQKQINATPSADRDVPVLLRGGGLFAVATDAATPVGIYAGSGAKVWRKGTAIGGMGQVTKTTGTGAITELTSTVPGPTVEVPVPGPTVEVQVPGPTVTVEVPVQPKPRAQFPVACRAMPKKLRRGKTVTLLDNTCVTSGGKIIKTTVRGRATLVKKARGRLLLKVATKGGKVTITRTAAATGGFVAYKYARTYKV